uniref:Uncharacterized protein n=1 Tax=Setaria italica TaxID=4555 RepID=K4ANR3_SETIT
MINDQAFRSTGFLCCICSCTVLGFCVFIRSLLACLTSQCIDTFFL